MNVQRVIHAASDCIAKFKSSHFPLKKVAESIIVDRSLNSRERKMLLHLVFRYSKEIHLIEKFVRCVFRFSSAMTAQQREMFSLKLLSDQEFSLPITPNEASMVKRYESFVNNLQDERYLVALGPLLEQAFQADYPLMATTLAKSLFERAKKYLAVDQRHVNTSQICERLASLGYDYFLPPILPTAIGIYEAIDLSVLGPLSKYVWIMDVGSQSIAELIKPKPNENVLDMCAGTGNKAFYISARQCKYTAMDISEQRLKTARRRLQGRQINFVCGDGRASPFSPNTFDWVLLDAPCSGTGTLRRHFDLVHRLSPSMIKDYQTLQRQLLKSAAELIKPGGKLIYATCSLLKVENEQQIEWIMQENNQIKPLCFRDFIVDYPNITGEALIKNSLTLFPHIHDCDGFFVAAFSK